MANLLPAAVVINGFYYENARVGSKKKYVDATLTLTGQGGGTNLIPASLFGLTTITKVQLFQDSTNLTYMAAPDYATKTGIIINQLSAAALSLKFYQATGLASTGDITVAGITTAETLVTVQDLTTPAELGTTNFTIKTGGGKITQASGAGDLHLIQLRFTTQKLTQSALAPTDLTATVRCLVVGNP